MSLKIQTVIPVIFFVFVASYLLTELSLPLGDRWLREDHIRRANFVYQTLYFTNPFNSLINKRVNITKALLGYWQSDERDKNILGTSVNNINTPATIPPQIRQPPVNILLYHHIQMNPNQKDNYGDKLFVNPGDFKTQINYLASQNYRTLSLDDFATFHLESHALTEKTLVLTFDDGYEDFFTNAFPILKQHHMKAVCFLITDFIGQPTYLTWNEINQMFQSGLITFESHTVDHILLSTLSNKNILVELVKSKKILELHFQQPINWIAYPYGQYDDRIKQLVNEAGYQGAVDATSDLTGFPANRFAVPRINIYGNDTFQDFLSKLTNTY